MDAMKDLEEENDILRSAKRALVEGKTLQPYQRDLVVSKLDWILQMNQEAIRTYENILRDIANE